MIEISFRHGRWYGMCHHQTPSAAQKIVKLESLVGSDPDVPDRDPTLCSQHIVRKTNSPETTNQRIHGTTTLASSNRRQGWATGTSRIHTVVGTRSQSPNGPVRQAKWHCGTQHK